MNIAIIDADLIGKKKHRFPNLASMKLSGHYKELSSNVILVTDYRNLFSEYTDLPIDEVPNFNFIICENINKKYTRYYKEENIIYDKIIISKVFTDTEVPLQILSLSNCEYGGTGFFYDKAPDLPYEIEHHMPDYHLYDDWVNERINKGAKRQEFEYYLDYSIGFTTRKCFRGCEFCVNRNYKKVELHSPINEFYDSSRKYICLLDDNILGYSGWKDIITELQQTNRYFQYKQGMDERMLTQEKCEILVKSKYKGNFIFAFDNIEDKPLIENKLQLLRQYTNKQCMFYIFCGFDRDNKWDKKFWKQDIVDTFERIKTLMQYGCISYIMRFNRYEESPYRGDVY